MGRTLLVTLLGVVSMYVVTVLDKVVALLGAVLGVPLGYCVPLVIHMRLVDDSTALVRVVNALALALGVVMALVCSFVTIELF